jgi:hypothetical protein
VLCPYWFNGEEELVMSKPLRMTIFVALTLLLVGYLVAAQEEPYAPVIDPANFVEGINHPYFSLTPGTTYIYESTTEDGLERTEVSVLPDTKQILGVSCTVVRDTVWLDGELVEDTFDWYAQDKDGNVWYMGEDTKEYEDGVAVSTAGAWEAGVDGAQPGIIMEANPQIGDVYRQEYYAGEAEDMAEILNLSDSASVPYGVFDNVLVTKEWTPLEPDVAEQKYYAQGIGMVFSEVVEGGTGRMELVDIVMLQPIVEDEGEDDEAEEMLTETPVISAAQALTFAETYLEKGTAHEVELEYEGGRWVYGVEIGIDEVIVDAITGDVLGLETDD